MISIERIDVSFFNRIYPLFRDLHDPNLTEDDWRTIFKNIWEKDETYCGYGLFDDGKIVGFIGLIFSEREIEGKTEPFCNITSWIVKEQYRNQSLPLVLKVLKLKNHTLTDLSPTNVVVSVLKRFGFKDLDSEVKILLPWGISGRRCLANVEITGDEGLIKEALKDNDLKLFHDHKPYKCNHLVAQDRSGYCYIIYTTVKHTRFPYCHIQYISNPELFSKYSSRIISAIAKYGQTRIVTVDSRLVKDIKFPFCSMLSIGIARLYKSVNLKPDKIDNLYSEFVLLNFNTLPTSFKHLWQKRISWRCL